jgi:serine protease Do
MQGVVVYGAEIIKIDEENDLALLKTFMVDDELEVAKIATTEPQKGDIVYSVGSPLGILRTVSQGILSNKVEGFYLSDNTTTFGNSGGGLYNTNGELIGVPAQVMGYGSEELFAPESSLGMSINLPRIRLFLDGEI